MNPLEKRNALEEGQKQGCYVSTTLAIVVARRSWREISLWKTQHSKNSLNFVSTCLRVVDARRKGGCPILNYLCCRCSNLVSICARQRARCVLQIPPTESDGLKSLSQN